MYTLYIHETFLAINLVKFLFFIHLLIHFELLLFVNLCSFKSSALQSPIPTQSDLFQKLVKLNVIWFSLKLRLAIKTEHYNYYVK